LSDAQNNKPKVAIEIRPLDKQHVVGAFSCGEPRIDNYLAKGTAWREQRRAVIRVYCATVPGSQDVVGYYSLTFIAWDHESAKDVVEPKHAGAATAQPAVYLPKVGVCEASAHQGIGQQLIMHAFEKSIEIADRAAVTTLTLHAIHEERAHWYERLGFVQFEPGDPAWAMGISLAKIRQALKA